MHGPADFRDAQGRTFRHEGHHRLPELLVGKPALGDGGHPVPLRDALQLSEGHRALGGGRGALAAGSRSKTRSEKQRESQR